MIILIWASVVLMALYIVVADLPLGIIFLVFANVCAICANVCYIDLKGRIKELEKFRKECLALWEQQFKFDESIHSFFKKMIPEDDGK